jgi:hypothetical protein
MIKKINISNPDVEILLNATKFEFPKYVTQYINLVNGNAQGTRPRIVGQMSDLIQEFNGETHEEWINWYNQKKPESIKKATNKIYDMFLKMKDAFNSIDKEMIEEWVKDLVYKKTFCGLKVQQAIIANIAKSLGKTWRLSNKEEESKGIDGYIGSTPVQVKSYTYKNEGRLNEVIEVPIIYYKKNKNGLTVEYDQSQL